VAANEINSKKKYACFKGTQRMLISLQLENVKLEIPMPKSVLNCTLTSTQGKYTFDPVAKSLSWDIGKIDTQKSPNIRGTVSK
jgi:AP-3 complex subunit mu